jgi:hypothetical protein
LDPLRLIAVLITALITALFIGGIGGIHGCCAASASADAEVSKMMCERYTCARA